MSEGITRSVNAADLFTVMHLFGLPSSQLTTILSNFQSTLSVTASTDLTLLYVKLIKSWTAMETTLLSESKRFASFINYAMYPKSVLNHIHKKLSM